MGCSSVWAASFGAMASITSYKMMPLHQRQKKVLLARMLLSTWAVPLIGVLFVLACVVTNRRPFSGFVRARVTLPLAVSATLSLSFEAICRYRKNKIISAPAWQLQSNRAHLHPTPGRRGTFFLHRQTYGGHKAQALAVQNSPPCVADQRSLVFGLFDWRSVHLRNISHLQGGS